MIKYDGRISFVALSFVTTMLSGETILESDADKTISPAQSIEALCKKNIAQP